MWSAPIQGFPYNSFSLRMYEVIEIRVRWDWDGLSLTNPTGPVVDIFVSNVDTMPWTATLPNKNKGEKTVVIPAGSANTYSGGVLNNMGLSDVLNASGVTLSRG